MKEIKHETIADETNYLYFRITNRPAFESDSWKYGGEPSKGDECKRNPSNTMTPSFHKAMEIWLVAKGKYVVWVNDEQIELKEGDIFFVDSYKTHYYISSPGASSVVLVFDDALLKNIAGANKCFPMIIKEQALFSELLDAVKKVYDGWENLEKERQIGFVYRFLGTVLQYVSPENRERQIKGGELAQQIIEYVYEHYNEPLNIKSLAQKFGYSEGYFSELFNKIVGMNIREYLNRYRIAVADRMKEENPQKSLREISETVGYTSWVTFFRAYTKYSKFKDNEK